MDLDCERPASTDAGFSEPFIDVIRVLRPRLKNRATKSEIGADRRFDGTRQLERTRINICRQITGTEHTNLNRNRVILTQITQPAAANHLLTSQHTVRDPLDIDRLIERKVVLRLTTNNTHRIPRRSGHRRLQVERGQQIRDRGRRS